MTKFDNQTKKTGIINLSLWYKIMTLTNYSPFEISFFMLTFIIIQKKKKKHEYLLNKIAQANWTLITNLTRKLSFTSSIPHLKLCQG